MIVLRRGLQSCNNLRYQVLTATSRFSVGLQCRKMSDHIERTADNFRQPGVSEAVVSSIQDLSPTVKHLALKIDNPQFSFKAGQWVDFLIPSVKTIGGYSMSCAPYKVQTERLLELAVKYSEHAPAHWIHKKCKVGDKVGIRVGGDQIIFDPKPRDPKADILLIAGGIGINPLISILRHVAYLHNNGSYDLGKVHMLYSASSLKELIFKENIEDICKNIPDVRCDFFVTKEKPSEATSSAILTNRINKETLQTALKSLDTSNVQCYVCGPPPMIASMETYLEELGIPKDQFHCEKWW